MNNLKIIGLLCKTKENPLMLNIASVLTIETTIFMGILVWSSTSFTVTLYVCFLDKA